MLLYINGCSHAAGAEIEFKEQTECYNKSFGELTANQLGWKNHNNSAAGGSNDRIIRTTVNFIENYKISNNIHDLYVVIAWTGADRTEITFNGNTYQLCLGSNWYRYPSEVIEYYKSYLTTHSSGNVPGGMILKMLLLQEYLKSNEIKFTFISSFWDFTDIHPDNQLLFNSLDPFHFFNKGTGDGNFFQTLDASGFLRTNRGHYLADGHAHYSKILSNRIKNQYPDLT